MAAKVKTPAPVNEIEVLFPEEQVGPYKLAPWTLAQFLALTGILLKMMEAFIGLGMNVDNADAFLEQDFTRLMPTLAPLFPEIIGVTLRLTLPEVAEISIGLQAALGLKILLNKQNQEQLKNFLAGFSSPTVNPALSTH